MSHIDPRLADPRRQPPDSALALFHAARRTAALALMAWLNTRPDTEDVTLEVHASAEIFRQLARLARGGAP